MAKIAIVTDKINSAIHGLALDVKKYNPHHTIEIFDVHPKRPTAEQLNTFCEFSKDADVIDVQYWKSGELLRERFPEFFAKKTILAHHNPYDLDKVDYTKYSVVVTNNKTIKHNLFKDYGVASKLIYNTIDVTTFDYLENYTFNKVVGMVAGRIEGKKGILEVAEICKKLGYTFLLVGRISDATYFEKIKAVGVEFHENVSDAQLRELYHKMGVLVVNSVPNFESGPLPPLEAMASGIPVVSNMVGTMVDVLRDKNNSIVHDGDLENVLRNIQSNNLEEIRSNGWELAKTMDSRRRARQYSDLYYSLRSYTALVSVILPTCDRATNVAKIVKALNSQTYDNIELVICDDGDEKIERAIPLFRSYAKYPIKYIKLTGDGYQLAKARNLGAIEAEGLHLMFLDDRLLPQKEAIECFMMSNNYEKSWFFGNKGTGKKSFVENFSFVRRKDFIDGGMFCERMDRYGGLSQETRSRFMRQGFILKYISSAKAEAMHKSGKGLQKRRDIIEMKLTLFKMGY